MLAGSAVPQELEVPVEDATACETAQCDERAEAEAAIVRDLHLFHACIAEGVEAAVELLLSDIAADVLARELQIAPAEIESIVRRALERYAQEQPLRVRLSPSEAARISCSVPIVADECLREGDAVIELRDGSIDASLGVRLACVLERAAQ
jgi:flagellar biosynthesis/type III secretory pathway protein FliH